MSCLLRYATKRKGCVEILHILLLSLATLLIPPRFFYLFNRYNRYGIVFLKVGYFKLIAYTYKWKLVIKAYICDKYIIVAVKLNIICRVSVYNCRGNSRNLCGYLLL